MHFHLSQCPRGHCLWGCLPRQSSWIGAHATLVPSEGFGPPSLFSHFLLDTPCPPSWLSPRPPVLWFWPNQPLCHTRSGVPISAVPVAQSGDLAAPSFLIPSPHICLFSPGLSLSSCLCPSVFLSTSAPLYLYLAPSDPVAGTSASWALSLWAPVLAVSALPTWLGRLPRHLFPCPLAGPHEALRQHLWSQHWANARGTAVIPRRQGRGSRTRRPCVRLSLGRSNGPGLPLLEPLVTVSSQAPNPQHHGLHISPHHGWLVAV